MDRITITRAFNNLFIQFLDEMIAIVPVANDIVKAKSYFETIKQMNPALIIKVWFQNIYLPYMQVIEQGNIVAFLLNKDFTNDVNGFENTSEILKVINQLRVPIREMTEENKEKSMNYIKKLSALSIHYSNK